MLDKTYISSGYITLKASYCYSDNYISHKNTSQFQFNSSHPGQNGRRFGRRHFQKHFLEWRWYNANSNLTEICYQESNWQQASISSGNGLAPNRRQAIIWTNDEPVHWHICGTRGRWVNSLWPGDTVWQHKYRSTLALVIACAWQI